jgi:hypothetical protein
MGCQTSAPAAALLTHPNGWGTTADMKIIRLLLIPILCLFLTGCLTSAKRLTRVHLDMTKDQVTAVLGQPTAARASIRNKYGQVIEVWEYLLDRGLAPDGTYWLYFYDDKLVQWGEAGDWQREADRIYSLRFGQPPASQ